VNPLPARAKATAQGAEVIAHVAEPSARVAELMARTAKVIAPAAHSTGTRRRSTGAHRRSTGARRQSTGACRESGGACRQAIDAGDQVPASDSKVTPRDVERSLARRQAIAPSGKPFDTSREDATRVAHLVRHCGKVVGADAKVILPIIEPTVRAVKIVGTDAQVGGTSAPTAARLVQRIERPVQRTARNR